MATLSKIIWMFAGRPDAALVTGYAELVRAVKLLLDPYRPELHYMRGPGPKWHAKHGRPPECWQELIAAEAIEGVD